MHPLMVLAIREQAVGMAVEGVVTMATGDLLDPKKMQTNTLVSIGPGRLIQPLLSDTRFLNHGQSRRRIGTLVGAQLEATDQTSHRIDIGTDDIGTKPMRLVQACTTSNE
jgi:hypothetical protein